MIKLPSLVAPRCSSHTPSHNATSKELTLNQTLSRTPAAAYQEGRDLARIPACLWGRMVDAPASGKTFSPVNPYAGQAWATVPEAAAADVAGAITKARAAFDSGPWPAMVARERAALLRRLAEPHRCAGCGAIGHSGNEGQRKAVQGITWSVEKSARAAVLQRWLGHAARRNSTAEPQVELPHLYAA